MGVQLEAFKVICDCKDEGATTEQIVERSGASPVVVGISSPIKIYSSHKAG